MCMSPLEQSAMFRGLEQSYKAAAEATAGAADRRPGSSSRGLVWLGGLAKAARNAVIRRIRSEAEPCTLPN